MRKVVSSKQILASTALAASLAIFGCTTNHVPGDGQPSSMPYHSPAATAPTNGTSGGAVPGTSGGITPMISSGPASMTTPSVDAYAVVAEAQGFRGRILGPSFPGQPDIASAVQPTGQFQNPALAANPEITVNRSISSDATPAVINDTATGLVISGGGATTAASTVATTGTTTGTTAAATVAGTGAATAPVTTSSAVTATPAQVVTGAPTATQSSLGVPSPTLTVAPVTVAPSSSGRTTATATTATVITPATTQLRSTGNLSIPSTASLPTMISSSGNVRLMTTSSGTPLITNTAKK